MPQPGLSFRIYRKYSLDCYREVLAEVRRKLDSKTRFQDNKVIYHSKYKYTEVQEHETMYGLSQLT